MDFIVQRYFTLWTWIFFFLYPEHPMNLGHSMISSVGGFYITYIYPRFLQLPMPMSFWGDTVTIEGPTLWMVDVISHHSLFLYQLYRYFGRFHYPWTTVLRWHGLFILYFATCFNPENYSLRWSDVWMIVVVYMIFFVVVMGLFQSFAQRVLTKQ